MVVAQEVKTSYYFNVSLSYCLNTGLSFHSKDWMVHAPFILDCGNAWIVRHGKIVPRWTTFSQRVQYFDQFRATGEAGGIWLAGDLEAANSTLGNLMEVSLTWALRFAQEEANVNFSRANATEVLVYIRSELGDLDLHTALTSLYRSSQARQYQSHYYSGSNDYPHFPPITLRSLPT